MAHGKIRVNTLTYDTGSGDVDVAVSGIPTATDIAGKANAANAALTGTPTAPTAAVGTNTTQLATTAYVQAEVGQSIQAHDADTAKTDVTQTFTKAQRGDIVDVTGTTPSFDLNAGNNFKFTTSANWTSFTLANLATAAEGQTGSIFIVYGGAHSGPVAGSMKFVGGSSSITLTSTATKIDRIDYIVLNSTTLTCNFTANYE